MGEKKKVNTKGFIQPLDTCCCGCRLDFGIQIILLIHSISCMFYIETCVSNIVLEMPTFGNKVTLYTQTFNCAWALATIPFIASGVSGVRNHVEIHLRIYLYWLMTTVAFDLVLTGMYLSKSMCNKMPTFLLHEGGAFACGTMRMFGIFFMLFLFGFSFYAIFVVWSRCEELEESGSEPSFDTLIGESRATAKRAIYEHKSGLFGTGPPLPSHGIPIMYGSLASPGFGGSGRIFAGRNHCTDYPPPHQHFYG